MRNVNNERGGHNAVLLAILLGLLIPSSVVVYRRVVPAPSLEKEGKVLALELQVGSCRMHLEAVNNYNKHYPSC